MEIRARRALPTSAHENMFKVVDRAPPTAALSPRTTRGFASIVGLLCLFLLGLTLFRHVSYGPPPLADFADKVAGDLLKHDASRKSPSSQAIVGSPEAIGDASLLLRSASGASKGFSHALGMRHAAARTAVAACGAGVQGYGDAPWPGSGSGISDEVRDHLRLVRGARLLDAVNAAEAGGVTVPLGSWDSWLRSVSILDGDKSTTTATGATEANAAPVKGDEGNDRNTGHGSHGDAVDAEAMVHLAVAAELRTSPLVSLVAVLSAPPGAMKRASTISRSGKNHRDNTMDLTGEVLRNVMGVRPDSAVGSRKALRGVRLVVFGDPCAAAAACALAEFSSCRSLGQREGGHGGRSDSLAGLLKEKGGDRALSSLSKGTILLDGTRGRAAIDSLWGSGGDHTAEIARLSHAADATIAFVPHGSIDIAASTIGKSIRVGTKAVIVSSEPPPDDCELGGAFVSAVLRDATLGIVTVLSK